MTFDKYTKHRLCDLYQRHEVNYSILPLKGYLESLLANRKGLSISLGQDVTHRFLMMGFVVTVGFVLALVWFWFYLCWYVSFCAWMVVFGVILC